LIRFSPEDWERFEVVGKTPLSAAVRKKLEHVAQVYQDRSSMIAAGEPVVDVKKQLEAIDKAATDLVRSLQDINQKKARSAWNRLRPALAVKRGEPITLSVQIQEISAIADAAKSAIGHLPPGKNEGEDPHLAALIFCVVTIFRDDAHGGSRTSPTFQQFLAEFCSKLTSIDKEKAIENAGQPTSAWYKTVERAMARFSKEPPPFDWLDWTDPPQNRP